MLQFTRIFCVLGIKGLQKSDDRSHESMVPGNSHIANGI